jgi:hypothetical protein
MNRLEQCRHGMTCVPPCSSLSRSLSRPCALSASLALAVSQSHTPSLSHILSHTPSLTPSLSLSSHLILSLLFWCRCRSLQTKAVQLDVPSDEEKKRAMDVYVDVLLSLLASPSRLMRDAVKFAFRAFVADASEVRSPLSAHRYSHSLPVLSVLPHSLALTRTPRSLYHTTVTRNLGHSIMLTHGLIHSLTSVVLPC